MPKKKSVPPNDTSGRTPFVLRFDDALYTRLRLLAEETQVSLNQLMQGLTRWAVENAHIGEPYRDEEGCWRTKSQQGCIWFGESAELPDRQECEYLAAEYGGTPESHCVWSKGRLAFALDFTERRVVREDIDEGRDEPPRKSSDSSPKRSRRKRPNE